MKRNLSLLLLTMFLFCTLSAQASPIEGLLRRILPNNSDHTKFTTTLTADTGAEYFTLQCDGNMVNIEGNSYTAIASGINYFLHHHAGITISWNGFTATLPATLPVVASSRHDCTATYRYYLNYCTYSYSTAFWGWERWQQEIDWMALHGINFPLTLVGTGTVWKAVLEKYGYTFDEINKFVAGPGFQAWFLMNNLQGWGGANTPEWYRDQELLQDSILARMSAFGMTPVLPGFAGMVPSTLAQKLPEGWESDDILSSGGWCGFTRPSFIDDTERLKEFAAVYYSAMDSLFGKYCSTHYYSMDPFHEGAAPSGITSTTASYQAMYDAMKAHDADGVWVAQSWGGNPTQALMQTVPQNELIVLDLFSDGTPKWSTGGSYQGHPWIFCMLHNFGGRIGLHGRMANTISGYYSATAEGTVNPAIGIGATPEGIETNPVLYDLLYELPWSRTITPESWVKDYVFMRYGKHSEALEAAWTLLTGSVYNCRTSQQGTSESILCARPALSVSSASTWSTSSVYWDKYDVIEAAELFLSVQDEFKGNNNFCYDLTDIMRQCISTHAIDLLAAIKTAKESNGNYKALTPGFLQLILDQDSLLGSRAEFRLGTWTEKARALGHTDAEKDWYEFNARVQVTTWGPFAACNGGGLHDYSNREWNGLLKDYYYPRWKAFFSGKCAGISTTVLFDNFEYPFAQGTKVAYGHYTAAPEGDCIAIADSLFRKYFNNWRNEKNSAEVTVGGVTYLPFDPDTTFLYNIQNAETWCNLAGTDAWTLIAPNSDYSTGYRLGWKKFAVGNTEFQFRIGKAGEHLYYIENIKAKDEGSYGSFLSATTSSSGYPALTLQEATNAEPFYIYKGEDDTYLLRGSSETFYAGADCRWGGDNSCVLYSTDPASTSLKAKVLLNKVIPDHIESIATDDNNQTFYYNLQGLREKNPGKGLYIVTSTGSNCTKQVSKVVIR